MQADPANSPQLQTVSREAFWHRHVTQWRTSGLSKMAYSQEYALVYHQMVYWCKKAEQDADQPAVSSGQFVPVAVAPALSDRSLCVRLPNGIAIEGIDERSVALVGKLVEHL